MSIYWGLRSSRVDPFAIFDLVLVQSLRTRPTLCDPMDYSTPGFPVFHYLLEFAQTHVIELMMPSNYLILCCPLLLLPSMFPSIRVFSSESALRIRWPKYWSLSFSISPSSEYSGLIPSRMDWAATFYETVNLPWLAWTPQFFLALCCWSLVSQNLKRKEYEVWIKFSK